MWWVAVLGAFIWLAESAIPSVSIWKPILKLIAVNDWISRRPRRPGVPKSVLPSWLRIPGFYPRFLLTKNKDHRRKQGRPRQGNKGLRDLGRRRRQRPEEPWVGYRRHLGLIGLNNLFFSKVNFDIAITVLS